MLSLRETAAGPARPLYLIGSHRPAHELVWTHTVWTQPVNFVQGLLFNTSRHVFLYHRLITSCQKRAAGGSCWAAILPQTTIHALGCPLPSVGSKFGRNLVQGATTCCSWSGPLCWTDPLAFLIQFFWTTQLSALVSWKPPGSRDHRFGRNYLGIHTINVY